jgi:hypothetical protein
MTNLHDFSLAAQFGEYVVGLAGLLLFIPLWKLITKPRKVHHER